MGAANSTNPPNSFLEPYIWNQFLMLYATLQIPGCNTVGLLGLILYNDNGEMMNRCYMIFEGDIVNYEMIL